jgi:LuxR family maltose regulon positive regulatory protein
LGWLDALPGPVIADHPELTAAKAMGLLLTGQLDDVDSMLAALDDSGVEPSPVLEGKLLAVRTWLADARGEPRSTDTAERALNLLPEEAVLYRILALIPLSHARTEAGDILGSTEALRDAYRLATDADQSFAAMGALANLAFNLLEQGARHEALALCETACSRYTDDFGHPLPVLGLVYLPMATAYYMGDDLDRAEHYAREGLALCCDLFSGTMAGGDAERVLARVTFARGEHGAALDFLEEARLLAESRGVTHVALVFAATSAMLRLRLGEAAPVGRWLASLGTPIPRQVRSAHLAWLLAAGRWEEAESQLAARARQLQGSEQFGRLIYVLLMQAQAAAGQGQRADALGYLEAAVKRAAPDGYRRPFLDAPAEVQMLLPHVRTTAPAFVDDLLGRGGLDVTPPDAPETLIELLSDRELEVLGLIAAGLSNREIAERLFITVGTVKRHAHNLYGKLQVGNRTEAVARARELTII